MQQNIIKNVGKMQEIEGEAKEDFLARLRIVDDKIPDDCYLFILNEEIYLIFEDRTDMDKLLGEDWWVEELPTGEIIHITTSEWLYLDEINYHQNEIILVRKTGYSARFYTEPLEHSVYLPLEEPFRHNKWLYRLILATNEA